MTVTYYLNLVLVSSVGILSVMKMNTVFAKLLQEAFAQLALDA